MRNSLEPLRIMLLRYGWITSCFIWNIKKLHTWDCLNLEELQRAVVVSNLQGRQATRNRFTYACFLADLLKTTLMWQPFPKDSIWCTPSVQLAYLLKEHRANLFIPGHSSAHRFQCIRIREAADTVTLQDVMGVSVRIYLNPKAGHSTLKDVLFLNFPAARDIQQLRALLTGTPVCEMHDSSRSAIHRQGTLIDFGALDGQRDLADATRSPPPSHVDTPVLGERTDGADEDTWCIAERSGDVKTADGTHDQ
jgi:hypothetical protein